MPGSSSDACHLMAALRQIMGGTECVHFVGCTWFLAWPDSVMMKACTEYGILAFFSQVHRVSASTICSASLRVYGAPDAWVGGLPPDITTPSARTQPFSAGGRAVAPPHAAPALAASGRQEVADPSSLRPAAPSCPNGGNTSQHISDGEGSQPQPPFSCCIDWAAQRSSLSKKRA